MRILISAAFVAITLAYLFLSHKQQQLEVARLGKPSPVWQGIAFQATFLTLLFAGFSVLTGVLLPGLWMLMIGVALVGQFVYIITGAVAGFWLPGDAVCALAAVALVRAAATAARTVR